jgi:xanthine dehydrogenase accessory factor
VNELQRFYADAGELVARREPFATATVVRAERPTSAKPGAKAIVTREGTLHGWIGGSCAAPVVVREALAALSEGEPRLIVLSNRASPSRENVRHFPMTCHSGGELEIYIEPQVPREQLVVIGTTPVARALASIGATLGLDVAATLDGVVGERDSVVIASRGDGDEDAVRAALATPARYVALVASRRRGDELTRALAEEGVALASLKRLRYPAGFDIGARSEEEIALSILSEIVATRAATASPPQQAPAKAEAIDPICGMSVAITPDALRAEHEGATYYFCSRSCVRRFLADPAGALASSR